MLRLLTIIFLFVSVLVSAHVIGANDDDSPTLPTRNLLVKTAKKPTCFDKLKNGSESDKDCGGSCKTKCANKKGCSKSSDCLSRVCKSKKCAAPTCSDGVKNGAESDKDCGGSCPTKCANTKGCSVAADCQSGVCKGSPKKCAAPTCSDGVKNGSEVDIDCGGSCPTKCADNKSCLNSSDCQSAVCNTSTKKCTAPTCSDGVKNGQESDIDCGGSCPAKCNAGKKCSVDTDCQSGACIGTTPKTCTTPTSVSVVYFTNWAQYRTGITSTAGNCSWKPVDFTDKANLATHINFAFAAITADFKIHLYEGTNDIEALGVVTGMKTSNPNLKVLLSVGGYGMNSAKTWDNKDNEYCTRLRDMVSTQSNRAAFISDVINICSARNLDGIDIDWEYPGDTGRCGSTDDKANLVLFAKDFKQAAPSLLLTMAPGAYGKGRSGYDLAGLAPYVDLLNLMTYDFHGPWDAKVNFHTAWEPVAGSSSSYGIKDVLDYYTAHFPANKITMGVGGHARTWKLSSNAQTVPGSGAVSGGTAGACTAAVGYLSYREIVEMLKGDDSIQVNVNNVAKSAYIYRDDMWASFDTPQTLYSKVVAAQPYGLAGFMFWAADLEYPGDIERLNILKNLQNPGATFTLPNTPVCGGGKLGVCPNADDCCSTSGVCGITSTECGANCYSGKCLCGWGKTGLCQDTSLCCSQYGYCDTTNPYCGEGCYSGPCTGANTGPTSFLSTDMPSNTTLLSDTDTEQPTGNHYSTTTRQERIDHAKVVFGYSLPSSDGGDGGVGP